MEKTFLTCLIAGICGAIVRLLLRPETCWRRWLAQFLVGVFCAIFLGAFLGVQVVRVLKIEDVESTAYAVAATAFVVGTAGEEVIRMLQRKYGIDKSSDA